MSTIQRDANPAPAAAPAAATTPAAPAAPVNGASAPAQANVAAVSQTANVAPVSQTPLTGARESALKARERRNIEKENQLRQQRAEIDQREARIRERDELAARDGLAYLRSLGWTDNAIAQRLMGQGPQVAPATQAVQQGVVSKQEWDGLVQRLQRFEQQTTQQQIDAELHRVASEAAADTTRPYVASLAAKFPERFKAWAWRLARAEPHLTNDVYLDRIESELAELATLNGARASAPATAANAGQATPPGSSTPGSAPTLTTAAASERASVPYVPAPMRLRNKADEAQALSAMRKFRDEHGAEIRKSPRG